MKSWTFGDSIHRFATKEEAEKFERSWTLDRGEVREVDGEPTSTWSFSVGRRNIESWGLRTGVRFKTRAEAGHWFGFTAPGCTELLTGHAEAPTHQLVWRGEGREPFGSAQGFHRFANQKDAEMYTKVYTNELSGIQHSSLKPNSELEWTGTAFKVAPYSGDEVAPTATPSPLTWGTKDWRLWGFTAETDARSYFRTLPDQYQRETDLKSFRDMDPTHILDQGKIHPILSWGYVNPVHSFYTHKTMPIWFGTRAEAERFGWGTLPSSSRMVPSFKEVATHEFVWEKYVNGDPKTHYSWEHGCPPLGTYAQVAPIPESRRPCKSEGTKTSQPSEDTPSQESDGSQGLLWVMGAVLGVSVLLNKTRKELPGSSPSPVKYERVMGLTQGEEMPVHEALKSSC